MVSTCARSPCRSWDKSSRQPMTNIRVWRDIPRIPAFKETRGSRMKRINPEKCHETQRNARTQGWKRRIWSCVSIWACKVWNPSIWKAEVRRLQVRGRLTKGCILGNHSLSPVQGNEQSTLWKVQLLSSILWGPLSNVKLTAWRDMQRTRKVLSLRTFPAKTGPQVRKWIWEDVLNIDRTILQLEDWADQGSGWRNKHMSSHGCP